MEKGENRRDSWVLAAILIGLAIRKAICARRLDSLPPKEKAGAVNDNPRDQDQPRHHVHDAGEEEQKGLILPHSHPQQPSPDDEKWKAKQERNWRGQLRSQWAMVFVTGAGVAVAIYTLNILSGTLNATLKQAHIASDALRMQRPYMSMGKEDGVVAEYVPPAKGEQKGTIILYLQNTGPAAATRFIINRYSSLPPAEKGEGRHIHRYRVLVNGKPRGEGWSQGVTIGANSVYVATLDPKWVPARGEWKLIEIGQWDGGFAVFGNFEYCDLWGEYHCETFWIRYQPTPTRRFISSIGEKCLDPSLPDPQTLTPVGKPEARVEFLPCCEQPEERAVLQEEEKKNN